MAYKLRLLKLSLRELTGGLLKLSPGATGSRLLIEPPCYFFFFYFAPNNTPN